MLEQHTPALNPPCGCTRCLAIRLQVDDVSLFSAPVAMTSVHVTMRSQVIPRYISPDEPPVRVPGPESSMTAPEVYNFIRSDGGHFFFDRPGGLLESCPR